MSQHRKVSRPNRKYAWWLCGAVLLGLAGLIFLLAQLGIRAHRIDGGSMEPTLPVGSVVILYPAETLEKGDIVTFRDPENGQVITHTFIGYAKDGSLMTKGDANPTPDAHTPSLQKSHVIGVVWRHIDVFALSFWTTWRGIIVMVASLCLIVVLCSKTTPRSKESGKRTPTEESSPV